MQPELTTSLRRGPSGLPAEDQREDLFLAAEMMTVMMIATIIVAAVVIPIVAIVGIVTIPVRVITPVAMFVTIPPVVVIVTMIAGLRLRGEDREAEESGAEDGDGFEVHNVVHTPTRGLAENSYECVIFRFEYEPGRHGSNRNGWQQLVRLCFSEAVTCLMK